MRSPRHKHTYPITDLDPKARCNIPMEHMAYVGLRRPPQSLSPVMATSGMEILEVELSQPPSRATYLPTTSPLHLDPVLRLAVFCARIPPVFHDVDTIPLPLPLILSA
jgi:hypothetical protein